METRNLQRTDFDFWTTIQTRWRDMDALGHLNHTAYLTYMETARVDLFIQLGYSGIKKEMDESEARKQALDFVGFERVCCRQVFMGHVDNMTLISEFKRH